LAGTLETQDKPHIVVVANGRFPYEDRLLPIVEAADAIVAADGGANWLAAHDITPAVLVGDMDSISPELLATLEARNCRIVRYSSHKDETDTELALLEALALGARQITLVGALGGRTDHSLANILLLAMPALRAVRVRIFDGISYLSIIHDVAVLYGQAGDILSLLPIAGDAEGITTEGLEYPLRQETLPLGPARGVSNVFLQSTARVTVQRGKLLAVHTPRAYAEEPDQ
jgi:thiamine pyrophosphokinase